MKLSRFTGATTHDALQKVKATLGPDAVILDTQVARGGVVITAGVDREAVAAAATAAPDELLREVRALAALVRETVARPVRGEADESIAALARALAAQGVDGVLAASLLQATSGCVASHGAGDALQQALAGQVAPLAGRGIECFVGPPGDGKTTTVVKLAAGARRAGQRVALVSTDTHRVGAAAELEVYGRALGVRTARATSPEDLAAALGALTDYDRILVDTAGVAPGETAALRELTALLDAAGTTAERTLVASATHGAFAVASAWRTFADLGPQRGILTKCDAAPGGPLLAQLWQARVPVAHVTTGRRIPDDIEAATPRRLAECLLAA